MPNLNMMRSKATTERFKKLLETNREEMEKERIKSTESGYAKLHGISVKTLQKYMGPAPDKGLHRGATKKELPVAEINELRLTLSDKEIAQQYQTYPSNINIQCGTREELGIKQIYFKRDKPYRERKKPSPISGLKQDNWVYPEPTDYEKNWKKEAIDLDRPHPALQSKLAR